MKTSQRGIDLIKKFEGLRLTAYKAVPSEKYFTIGYGHYGADVYETMTITESVAEDLLKNDLKKFESAVEANTEKYSDLNQNQFDALVSFTYNCGAGNLKKLLNGRTLLEVADAMLLYNKAGGKELAGLTKRRSLERALFLEDEKMIIIGSARIDENGKISGGKEGDQKQTTEDDYSGEVSFQKFYVHKKGWYILRPKDDIIAAKLGRAMKAACINPHIGYDQEKRHQIVNYGIYTLKDCSCDCSSLVRACIKDVSGKDPGNFTTANEAAALLATGLFEPKKAYEKGTKLYEGDVLVTKTKGHTVIVTDGYERVSKQPKKTYTAISALYPTIRLESFSKAVAIWSAILIREEYLEAEDLNDLFGQKMYEATVNYQIDHELDPDGIVGPITWREALKDL